MEHAQLQRIGSIHLSMKEEDYLETILNVSLEKGYARTRDVADALGISSPSVVEMFVKLHEKKLVIYRKYEGVTLTYEGRVIAEQIKYRHDVLVRFLELLHVSHDSASKDACFMEHELSSETITQIKNFVEFVGASKHAQIELRRFAKFSTTGEIQDPLGGGKVVRSAVR